MNRHAIPIIAIVIACALGAAVAHAGSIGSGSGPVGGGTGGSKGGYWEGRIRIVHHYYDVLNDYTTFQAVTGSTYSQCDAALHAAFTAALAETTAQIAYDQYCVWRP